MTWRIARAAVVSLAWTSTVIASSAQTLDRGEINGTIRDESGAVLPGVAVTLRETKTGFERSTVSAAAGQYSGLLLPLGVYVVYRDSLSGGNVDVRAITGGGTASGAPVQLAGATSRP